MKKWAILILSLLTAGNLNCSGEGDKYLELVIDNPRAYLLPADTYSCKAIKEFRETPDLQGKVFIVPRTRLRWYHAYNSVEIVGIRFTFKHSGLTGQKATCDVFDEELLIAGGEDWGRRMLPAPGENYSNYTEIEFTCPLKCGGIKTIDQNFVATGTVEVIGVMTDSSGESSPVKGTTSFSIENLE